MIPFRTVPGARWSCRSSGFCCHHYELGPVEPEIVEALIAARIEELWPLARETGWIERRAGHAGEGIYLRKVDDHCVFLRDDNLCAIHAAFGAEAKPAFCREFPFYLVEDPLGIAAVTRPDCAGCHESAQSGEPVADQVAGALALRRQYELPTFFPEAVSVVPGRTIPLGEWMALEADLLDLVAHTPGPPEEAVGAIRRRLLPDLGPPDRARARLACRAVAEALFIVLTHAIAQPASSPAAAAFAADLHARVSSARDRLALPLPGLSADACAHLGRLMQADLLGKRFQARGSVGAGLGLFLANAAVARAAAIPGESGDVDAAGLASGLTRLSRLTLNRSVHDVLDRARPALVDLFLNAG